LAGNGEEAFGYASAEDFDLIITDVDMPVMGGLDLCVKLKKTPLTQHIPVIMLSNPDDGTGRSGRGGLAHDPQRGRKGHG